MKSIVVVPIVAAAVLFAGVSHADDPKLETNPAAAESKSASLSKEDLEKKFQETLTGAILSGHFSNDRDTKGTPKEDKYTIESVTKVEGDTWLFKARIQYGTHDVTLPLPLRVVWAGDTPVITVDKSPMPGLGKYSARVLIYDGRYAGTWDGGDHGGTLWGEISKEKKDPPAAQ